MPSLGSKLWEKEKLLVTSNFSFSHSFFYQFGELSAIFLKLKLSSANSFSSKESKNLSFGKELTTLMKNVENILGKWKNAGKRWTLSYI